MRENQVALDDKYSATTGRALVSGVEALVRLVLEQRRLDDERGLDTRAFVSGYQGSPLGTVDLEMGRAARHLDATGIVFRPAVNEELAATAVAGTQMLGALPGRRHDGVTGFWYGKAPGLDRAADAIRHGQLAGTATTGGAVAWIGDDPSCKSSTVPSSSEPMAQSLALPLFAPGTVAEIVPYGLHAVALSRLSGLWTGMKIVADVADSAATIDVGTLRHGIPAPPASPRPLPPPLVGPAGLDAEHDLLTARLDLARRYGAEHGLNRITFSARHARLGIVASGTAHAVVERALSDLGLDEAALETLGVRVIRLGMPFPLDPAHIAALTDGLEQVLVVEDKVPFVEDALKAALYRRPDAPVVVGRTGESGRPLLTARSQLTVEDIAVAVCARIGADRLPRGVAARLEALRPVRRDRIDLPVARRTPFFCSGCPHNRSTRTDDATLVGVGIGCHALIALEGEGRGTQIGLTQMGGEGAQWIGLAPFTDDPTLVQNIGDGTFHHSGSLAIRAAVAAGVRMTYKLLYNDAVAMTGGQRAEGRLDVASVVELLAVEGVRQVVVTTDDPAAYRRIELAPVASVRHRDDLSAVERELAAVDGVTVILHDDRCATEERRLRKRGALPAITERVVINERVCEGCGDCGRKSTCLSVQPVHTEFGRKTRIHQSSCNSDFSCLTGDCPSFLLVESRSPVAPERPDLPVALAEPSRRWDASDVLVRMPGIGGTGVVTASKILQMAAHLDGVFAAGLEQIGLAQKGGPVLSDVRISKAPITGSLRASRGTADALIGFDLLGAADAGTVDVCDPSRTVAVINSAVVPTAPMITGRVTLPGSPDEALQRIASATAEQVHLDAQHMAEHLFGDHMPANMVLLGAAYQAGVLPVSAEALEQAIRLNGTAVEKTLAAFRWGRAAVQDPEAVRRALHPAGQPVTAETDLDAVLAIRVADLTGYQNARYAAHYADEVRAVHQIAVEAAGSAAGTRIGVAYARGLHSLMAYKDEYEVARLHLDPIETARREAEFGADARVSVLLHPPVLRALGMKRKIRLRASAGPAFRTLRALRGLRGTPVDVFGYAKVRRTERALVPEYQGMVRRALTRLDAGTADVVEEITKLAELVRGYENVKLANVAQFRERAAELTTRLG